MTWTAPSHPGDSSWAPSWCKHSWDAHSQLSGQCKSLNMHLGSYWGPTDPPPLFRQFGESSTFGPTSLWLHHAPPIRLPGGFMLVIDVTPTSPPSLLRSRTKFLLFGYAAKHTSQGTSSRVVSSIASEVGDVALDCRISRITTRIHTRSIATIASPTTTHTDRHAAMGTPNHPNVRPRAGHYRFYSG